VSALYLLAVETGARTGKITTAEHTKLIQDQVMLGDVVDIVIKEYSEKIKEVATKNCNVEHWFFIGRGAQYPVALESALKFKEVSYLHAEAMPAGFFKHGTISLIDDKFYTVVFLPSQISDPEMYQQTMDNIHEIKARGGKIIGIGHHMPETRQDIFEDYISLPEVNKYLNTILQLVAGQLFAYYAAVELGRDIDKPRALAKSVTVR